jgi:hypothetical protein
VSGFTTPCPVTVRTATGRTICDAGRFVGYVEIDGHGKANVVDGHWSLKTGAPATDAFRVTSPAGGVATWTAAPPMPDVAAAAPDESAPRELTLRPKRLPRQ